MSPQNRVFFKIHPFTGTQCVDLSNGAKNGPLESEYWWLSENVADSEIVSHENRIEMKSNMKEFSSCCWNHLSLSICVAQVWSVDVNNVWWITVVMSQGQFKNYWKIKYMEQGLDILLIIIYRFMLDYWRFYFSVFWTVPEVSWIREREREREG